jgi:hypothetical protein
MNEPKMNEITTRALLAYAHDTGGPIMFNLSGIQESFFGERTAGVCQAITSALAFESGLEKSSISASVDNDVIYLEGTADSVEAIDIAINLASSISNCRILSHIEPCY